MSHNTIFRYNEKEYEFDIADADFSEKYEHAYEFMSETEKNIPKDGKLSDMYRSQCAMIKRFLDDCLEEGAGEALCGERNNITLCYNAYGAFLDFVSAQRESVLSIKNTFSKYSNRAQRRAAQSDYKK